MRCLGALRKWRDRRRRRRWALDRLAEEYLAEVEDAEAEEYAMPLPPPEVQRMLEALPPHRMWLA